MTTAATATVVTVSNDQGDVEVHKPGCRDLKKKDGGVVGDSFTWKVATAAELSHEFWNDQISDTVDPDSPEGWAVAESWVGTFHFMPCCPAFPGDQPNTVRAAAKEKAAAVKAKGTSRSAEARRRIMDRKFAEGYQAGLVDIARELEAGGAEAVAVWLKNNLHA